MKMSDHKEEIFKLIEQGLTEQEFAHIYKEFYNRVRCSFQEAYAGKCEDWAVMSVTYNDKETPLCEKHATVQCINCKMPATERCAHAGSLVCGYPLCGSKKCSDSHYRQVHP